MADAPRTTRLAARLLSLFRPNARPASGTTPAQGAIYAAANRYAFFGDVAREFDIEFNSHELKSIANRDQLMGLVRNKYIEKTGKIANSHWVWGCLEQLEIDHSNREYDAGANPPL